VTNITIQPFTAARIPDVVELQSAYSAVYPAAQVIPGEVYLSPAFEGGRNLFCAIDERGKLLGYAPLYPMLAQDASSLPHILWAEIKAHPACEVWKEVKDQLFEQVLLRAGQVTAEVPGHPVHLTFQYFPSETDSIEYILSKGGCYTESVFTMRRDLSLDIPAAEPLQGITIRPWRMESEAEQQLYVRARNECFPETPVELGEWQYFMQMPSWEAGTTFAAFDGDELVGNVAVFWDEAENRKSGDQLGFTEYIFVRPRWRGKNVARHVINAGLSYLKQHGLACAILEVRARNQDALRLYAELGYEVVRESCFYVLEL